MTDIQGPCIRQGKMFDCCRYIGHMCEVGITVCAVFRALLGSGVSHVFRYSDIGNVQK